jgi:2-oxoglutarate dehydrogenase E2 component (dihydrolipoamide succinyltransferase)
VSVNAPASGKITELLVNEEDTVMVGQDLFRFAQSEADESSASAATSSEATPQAEKGDAVKSKAVSHKQVPPPPPTPSQGRSKADVKETSKPAPAPKEESKQSTSPYALTTFAAVGGPAWNENRVKMSRMRLRVDGDAQAVQVWLLCVESSRFLSLN